MKKVIFIALMLTGQLFAQIENGLYYSEDIYRSDVNDYKTYNTIKIETSSYIDVTSSGIRIYPEDGIGLYYGWMDIGFFVDHYTYLLTNGSKICVGPEIKGIYYFYENEYNLFEYKKLIEFRNMIKVSGSKTGNYVMER